MLRAHTTRLAQASSGTIGSPSTFEMVSLLKYRSVCARHLCVCALN